MRTEEGCKVIKEMPLERIIVETQCPYACIRPGHHSAQFVRTLFPHQSAKTYDAESMEFALVFSRNEPVNIVQIIEVIAALKGLTT